jgi:signal transduction histidine kinase
MGGYPLLDVGRTSEGTLPLLYDLLDQLPVRVAMYGARAGFPLIYRNQLMAEQHEAAVAGLDLSRIQHPRLVEVAERLLVTRGRESVELNLSGRDGERLRWSWSLSPLLDAEGAVVALVAVVEDHSVPLLARLRIESAIDKGMHLLLEVARLAEEHPRMDEFLAAVAERAALLVQAGAVVFHRYDPERRTLVASPRMQGSGPQPPHFSSDLPCDPGAADPLSQVVFAGRVYSGTLDLSSLELRPYAHLAQRRHDRSGSRVLIVPWRAGNERLGAVVAHDTLRPDGFTDENAIVLLGAGHAAGLVWQRKRAEQKLAERAAELESLERAKTSFLMLASHELRTPLTLLNGYVSMLVDGTRSDAHMDEVLPILQQAVERMNVLVDQMMDATRMADHEIQLQRQPVDLRETLERAVNRVVSRWRRHDDFEIELPEGPISARVDVLRIETAIENLVDNAFKYSAPGERVRCALRLEPGVARLVVQDEGIGMSEQDMAQLFTRFGRIVNAENSHTTGAGLGLYLSREIARMHGGEITASSCGARGSRFELRLPVGGSDEGGESN